MPLLFRCRGDRSRTLHRADHVARFAATRAEHPPFEVPVRFPREKGEGPAGSRPLRMVKAVASGGGSRLGSAVDAGRPVTALARADGAGDRPDASAQLGVGIELRISASSSSIGVVMH